VFIKELNANFVDKQNKIMNNVELAEKKEKSMLKEFCLGRDLKHENIIEYKYFVKQYDKDTRSQEYHIILEQMKGGDLLSYIKSKGRETDIDKIKAISR
jgi:serine/threonine protein kinase